MVQLPEPTGRNDYVTIADIAKERIRRVGHKLNVDRSGQMSIEKHLDVGFRMLRLDRSNFKAWPGKSEEFDESGAQLEMHVDHLSPQSSAEDILYELLLKAGYRPTTEVKTIKLAGKEVFSIEDGTMLICLEKDITPDLIDALAEANPLQVICLDEGFKGNDQLKANAVQTFRARAEAEESEIVFKTV